MTIAPPSKHERVRLVLLPQRVAVEQASHLAFRVVGEGDLLVGQADIGASGGCRMLQGYQSPAAAERGVEGASTSASS